MTTSAPRNAAGDLEPALHAFEVLERGKHACRRFARSHGEPGSEERVRCLIVAEQRQANVIDVVAVPDAQALGEAIAAERLELQIRARLADQQSGAVEQGSHDDHLVRLFGVGIDDRNSVGREQLGEEAQLGREIGLDRRVIVEMIAAEVGEGGGLQPDAVEPVLVEAVRGGLEGQMRDALGRELRQRRVQRHRIGRGERAVDAAVGLDEADGADGGGLVAEWARSGG